MIQGGGRTPPSLFALKPGPSSPDQAMSAQDKRAGLRAMSAQGKEEYPMAIEIVFKKFLGEKGERLVLVTKVKALTREKLPREYLDGGTQLYQEGNYLVVVGDRYAKNFNGILGVGDIMDIGEANWWVRRIKRCGDTLHAINRERERKWEGNIKIEI